MSASSPLLVPLPFPAMTGGPIGAPDWMGQMALRTGNAILHPRRTWAWEMTFNDEHGRWEEDNLEELTAPAIPAKPDPVLRKWPSSISHPVSENAYSIMEPSRPSDVSVLPRPGGSHNGRLAPPSMTSGFLSVPSPSPSPRTPPSPSPSFPTSLPVPPPRDPRDPLLGSIITRPRRLGSNGTSSSSRRTQRPDDALMPPSFEVDDFSPPMTSTPHRATMPNVTSGTRRRGISLASLSLRRRPQTSMARSESTNFSTLGRRSATTAASVSKRGNGPNSTMSRSFSSRSFFSNRTFGVAPSPDASFQATKTVTDIDLITCMARNLVESASPIRNDYADEYYDDYDQDHSHSYSHNSRHYYDQTYIRGYYADEDQRSDQPRSGDVTHADDSYRSRESRSRRKRRNRRERSHEPQVYAEATTPEPAKARQKPTEEDDVADRLDRLLQVHANQPYLMVTPKRPSATSEGTSRTSGDSARTLPNWLVSAIHVGNTPQHRAAELAQYADNGSVHGKSTSGLQTPLQSNSSFETTDATQSTEDESDKENYPPTTPTYLKRASTSAFGPCPPAPSTEFPHSAPTTPKRVPLRGEAGCRSSCAY